MGFIFAYQQDPLLFLPCRTGHTKLNNIGDYTFIVTMETTVNDLLSILFPDPKQCVVLAQVPWRVGFSLIILTSLIFYLGLFNCLMMIVAS